MLEGSARRREESKGEKIRQDWITLAVKHGVCMWMGELIRQEEGREVGRINSSGFVAVCAESMGKALLIMPPPQLSLGTNLDH